jgi:ATP-dependent Clp protease protease subunit
VDLTAFPGCQVPSAWERPAYALMSDSPLFQLSLTRHHSIEEFVMFDSLSAYGSASANQRSREYTRQRQMGIGDLLLENRIVFLDGVINDGTANMIVMKLLFLQSENRHQDIHLYVNSPGGSVTATLAIYDTMQYLECEIATYCVGMAASGGAILVAGGSKKKRFTLPHAKMMIHQPYGEVGGQVSDIEIQAKDILKTRELLNEILSIHTGQSIEVVAKDTDRDRYLSATEAMEYGLVDEILVKESKESKKKSGT